MHMYICNIYIYIYNFKKRQLIRPSSEDLHSFLAIISYMKNIMRMVNIHKIDKLNRD